MSISTVFTNNFVMMTMLAAMLLPAAWGQPVVTEFQEKTEFEANFWVLSGQTNLPDGTTFDIELTFQNKQKVRLSKGPLVSVQQNKISYFHFLGQKIMPRGTYVWKLRFSKEAQTPDLQPALANFSDFEHTHRFVFGSPRQEREETTREYQFYLNVVQQVDKLVADVKTQVEQFGQKPAVAKDKVETWLAQTQTTVNELRVAIDKRKREIFLPRHPDNWQRLQTIQFNLNRWWPARSEQIRKHYGLPLPQGYHEQLSDKATVDFARYEKEIARMSGRITGSLPVPENVREQQLEADLAWFNQIFRGMVSFYQESQQQVDKDKWQEKNALFEQEIEDFASKAGEYAKSPLATAHANLVADLQKLVSCIRDLRWAYMAKVGKRHQLQVPPQASQSKGKPEELLTNLQQQFAQVYQIVSNKKAADEQAMLDAWKQMEEQAKLLPVLYGKLQEEAKKQNAEKVKAWHQGWLAELKKVADKSDAGKLHYSGLHVAMTDAIAQMRALAFFYLQMIEQKVAADDPRVAPKLRLLTGQFRAAMEKVEKICAAGPANN